MLVGQWDQRGPSWGEEACPRAAALRNEVMMFGEGGAEAFGPVSEERMSGGTSLERRVHSLFPLFLGSQQNLGERCTR